MDFNFILFISNYVLPDQKSWFYASCKLQCAAMTGFRGHQSFFYQPDTMACITLPDKIYLRQNLQYNTGYQYWMNNVEFCKSNPCKAGETCVDVTGGFECRCMNILKDSIITSPNYPANYDHYIYNCYLIIGRAGQNINLNLDAQYHIETDGSCDGPLTTGDLSCKFDYLELQGVRYCGQVPPDPMVIPTGTNTTVRFRTDSGHPCTGFKLTITYN